MKNKVSFTLRIDERLLKEVKIRSIEENISISEWISKAIELMLTYGISGSLKEENRL